MKLIFFHILSSSLALSAMALDYHPKGYFHSTDVTNVTWAHGVNSKSSLENNLKNDKIKMLEADIVMGYLKDDSENLTVIMAHPPENTSDLSFAIFIEEIIKHNKDLSMAKRKGMKLDFKEFRAAEEGLPLLKAKSHSELEFPIWINSDILAGPVNAGNSSINGTALIELQVQNVPNGTLSLGWTTRFGKQSNDQVITAGEYSREQIDEMVTLIKDYFSDPESSKAQITFPLRAGLALNSVENVKYLLDGSDINFTSPSITLWEGSTDPLIEQEQLDNFTQAIDRSRVFVDLPYSFPQSGGNQLGTGVGNFAIILSTILGFMVY